MVYVMIVIIITSIIDIKGMKARNQKKDIVIYITLMLLVGALDIYYFSNPKRDSFSEVLLSLIGQEG